MPEFGVDSGGSFDVQTRLRPVEPFGALGLVIAGLTSGHDPSAFLLTVFAGLDDRWLDPTSRLRQNLERTGVARLILLTEPPYDPERIREAGRMLTPQR